MHVTRVALWLPALYHIQARAVKAVRLNPTTGAGQRVRAEVNQPGRVFRSRSDSAERTRTAGKVM